LISTDQDSYIRDAAPWFHAAFPSSFSFIFCKSFFFLVISSPSRNTHCFHLSWPAKEVLLAAENSFKSPSVSLPLQYHSPLLLFGLWVFELSSKSTQLQQLKTGSKSFKTLLSSSLLVLLVLWVLIHFFPNNKRAAANSQIDPLHPTVCIPHCKTEKEDLSLFPLSTLWSCSRDGAKKVFRVGQAVKT